VSLSRLVGSAQQEAVGVQGYGRVDAVSLRLGSAEVPNRAARLELSAVTVFVMANRLALRDAVVSAIANRLEFSDADVSSIAVRLALNAVVFSSCLGANRVELSSGGGFVSNMATRLELSAIFSSLSNMWCGWTSLKKYEILK
jgi:hypothetical protein